MSSGITPTQLRDIPHEAVEFRVHAVRVDVAVDVVPGIEDTESILQRNGREIETQRARARSAIGEGALNEAVGLVRQVHVKRQRALRRLGQVLGPACNPDRILGPEAGLLVAGDAGVEQSRAEREVLALILAEGTADPEARTIAVGQVDVGGPLIGRKAGVWQPRPMARLAVVVGDAWIGVVRKRGATAGVNGVLVDVDLGSNRPGRWNRDCSPPCRRRSRRRRGSPAGPCPSAPRGCPRPLPRG